MKKFMKITIDIVAKIAMVAITMAIAYGVNSVWGDVGVYALLGVALVGWIVAGVIPDKQALAYAEMQANLDASEEEVKRLQKEVSGAEEAAAKWQSEYHKKCAELEEQTNMYRESANIIHGEKAQFKHAWEEATKREEMLHKQLREKQGEMEYWRNKYDALKEEFEAYKAGELVRDGITLTTADDIEREGAVEVAVAEAKSEEADVEVASVPAPAPRRHKIKRQFSKLA